MAEPGVYRGRCNVSFYPVHGAAVFTCCFEERSAGFQRRGGSMPPAGIKRIYELRFTIYELEAPRASAHYSLLVNSK